MSENNGRTSVLSTRGAGGSSGQAAARQAIDVLHEIATLLNTQLDATTISICVSLIENGVNPEALAAVIKELRRESERIQQEQDT